MGNLVEAQPWNRAQRKPTGARRRVTTADPEEGNETILLPGLCSACWSLFGLLFNPGDAINFYQNIRHHISEDSTLQSTSLHRIRR
jgi:hypothetical protein